MGKMTDEIDNDESELSEDEKRKWEALRALVDHLYPYHLIGLLDDFYGRDLDEIPDEEWDQAGLRLIEAFRRSGFRFYFDDENEQDEQAE